MAISLFWMPNRHKDKLLGERLRLPCKNWGRFGSSSGKCYQPAGSFSTAYCRSAGVIAGQSCSFDGKLAKQQIEAAMGGLPVERGLTILKSSRWLLLLSPRFNRAIEIEW